MCILLACKFHDFAAVSSKAYQKYYAYILKQAPQAFDDDSYEEMVAQLKVLTS